MTAESTTSPSVSGILCFRTFTAPAESTNSIRTSVGELTVTDFSLPKSPCCSYERHASPSRTSLSRTWAGLHLTWMLPRERFHGPEARRSELPSRNTDSRPSPGPRHTAPAPHAPPPLMARLDSRECVAFPCSSAIASRSCGMEALMLGSLTMLASVFWLVPQAVNSSEFFGFL